MLNNKLLILLLVIFQLFFTSKQKRTSHFDTSSSSDQKTFSDHSPSDVHLPLCRTEWGFRLPYSEFALDTCAKCYKYMPDNAFWPNTKFRYIPGFLLDPLTNHTIPSNQTHVLSQTFVSVSLIIKWQQCCADALHCCLDSLQHQTKNSGYCERTWDGWSCWSKDAEPGTVQQQPCPKHIYWHSFVPPCRGFVTKECNSSGSWFAIDGREWSNYSNCARDDIFIGRIKYSIITNMISIFTLIPALFIFGHYKQLSSVSRIRLHKHLFTSLLLHACVNSLLKYHILTESQLAHQQPTIRSSSMSLSSIYCLNLSLLQRYFRSTTYLWMFNEALYLHQLIKHAFTQPPLMPLIFLAYLLPLTTTIFYILTRSIQYPFIFDSTNYLVSNHSFNANLNNEFDDPEQIGQKFETNETSFDRVLNIIDKHEDSSLLGDEDKCWLMPSKITWHEWIINAPNLAILVINCVFLFLLLRVLCIKASSSFGPPSSSGSSHSQNHLAGGVITRKSVMISLRAAVLLLPLYGLHYLVIVYRPNTEICWLSEVYHYFSLTLDGLQGCAVSIIFCFANNEIRYLLNRTFERVSSRQRSTTIYLTELNPTQQH